MRRTRIKPDNSWPSWMYNVEGEGRIFEKESDVPEGWTRKIGEIYEKARPVIHDHEYLVTQLTAAGIEINPIWGSAHLKRILDGDIRPEEVV